MFSTRDIDTSRKPIYGRALVWQFRTSPVLLSLPSAWKLKGEKKGAGNELDCLF